MQMRLWTLPKRYKVLQFVSVLHSMEHPGKEGLFGFVLSVGDVGARKSQYEEICGSHCLRIFIAGFLKGY